MTDLIKRDAALAAIDMALNNATGDLFDCHAAIRALPATDRIEMLVVERDTWREIAHNEAIEAEHNYEVMLVLNDKLAKAVEALQKIAVHPALWHTLASKVLAELEKKE